MICEIRPVITEDGVRYYVIQNATKNKNIKHMTCNHIGNDGTPLGYVKFEKQYDELFPIPIIKFVSVTQAAEAVKKYFGVNCKIMDTYL